MISEKEELYPETGHQIDNYTKAINNSGTFQGNKKTISDLVIHCQSKGLSPNRILFILQRLKVFCEREPRDFRTLTRQDIEAFLAMYANKGSKWTRDAYVVSLTTLYRFMLNVPAKTTLPDGCPMKGIPRSKGKTNIHKKMLFTDQEIKSMLDACPTQMWRCIIGVLSETGVRPGELRGLKIKDVTVESACITIHVSLGKMSDHNAGRDVFVIDNYTELANWLKFHPEAGNYEAWLFQDKGKPISINSLDYRIKDIAKRSKINGRTIKAYLFRHTALTKIYAKYPTEAARRIAGHEAGSDMPATYTHMDSDDLKEMLLVSKGKDKNVDPKEFVQLLLQFHKEKPEQFTKSLENMLKMMK